MGKLFYIMGKSASGKDKIFNTLLAKPDLSLCRFVIGTTRPRRKGETDGETYHFRDEAYLQRLRGQGRIVEERTYQTVEGPWTYFTADDKTVDLARQNYLGIGTLESYVKLRDYFGAEIVLPVYIDVRDEERLLRAIRREKKQAAPNYREVCRRFLADCEDFSEENIKKAGVFRRFTNNGELAACIRKVEEFIKDML